MGVCPDGRGTAEVYICWRRTSLEGGMARTDVIARLDRIERQLAALSDEFDEVRTLALQDESEPEPAAIPTAAIAWQVLERGRHLEALRIAEEAMSRALQAQDEGEQEQVAAFAHAAADFVDPGLAERARQLESSARLGRRRRMPFPSREQLPRAASAPVGEVAPPVAPAEEGLATPRGPSVSERLQQFATAEFAGARGFAVVGGMVTLLGVVFLFVLAANRGWIGPVARVSIGAAASASVFAAGMLLRVRYGRLQASLAAVGTGLASAYTTLAAATLMYGFLPTWGALAMAAAIAGVGASLGVRWSSEILTGLSLVGAAAAPALVAFDDGVSVGGTAFATVVLAAGVAAAVPRRWLWLVLVVGSIVLAQVGWLTAVSRGDDAAGAIAVACVTALVLLVAAIGWQETFSGEGLDGVAGRFAFASGSVALVTLVALLSSDRKAGVGLALAALVYASAGYAVGRRRRDLGWTTAAVAIALAGIATSLLLSQRSLTIAWAIEGAVLAALAWRLALPRFQLAGLAYLALGVAHAFAIDIWAGRPSGDLPAASGPTLLTLAAAVLVAGVLVVRERREPAAAGILARLEPLWNGLVNSCATLRFWLFGSAVFFAAAGIAALLSGRLLTLCWLATATALALTAAWLGERRLEAAALSFLVAGVLHALEVEATPATLVLGRADNALAPVPSLGAAAAACAIIAAVAPFTDRGIAFLGPLEGAERSFAWLATRSEAIRAVLLAGAAGFAAWSLGLLLVRTAYDPGQAGATGVWALLATAGAVAALRMQSRAIALASLLPGLFALGKASAFDWHELSAGWGATALLIAAAAILLVGFLADWVARIEMFSLVSAAVAVVAALAAVAHVAPGRTQLLGGAALGVAVVVALFAVPPYRMWRRGADAARMRNLATVYWSTALVTTAFAELQLVDRNRAGTAAAWAISFALVATSARALVEPRLWYAGAIGVGLATFVCLALVTVPDRLLHASSHPGARLWALVACIVALAWVGRLAPPHFQLARSWALLGAAALTVFALSLAVLEAAERLSGASVSTDFQRGHTAVSALWGALALGLVVAGLTRTRVTVRRVGLALFGLALAKLFLYDLRNLSSITRALSFLAVGAVLLAAAFFVERAIRTGGGGPGRAGPRPA
jgi:uncharacterized membrane protein